MTHLPTHPHLVHPRTGDPLRAIYRTRAGQLVYPQIGASTADPSAQGGTDPAAGAGQPPASTPAPGPADPQKPADEPLREPGKRALEAERARAKALEQQLADLAPLKQLADLLGGKPTGDAKTDLESLTARLDGYEQQITNERQARWRAEIAAETGLPPALAARLQGGTREELAADAEQLKALIPAAPTPGPRTPAPDPSQGARGPVDIDALIREAESKGNVRDSIRLKATKAAAARTNQ